MKREPSLKTATENFFRKYWNEAEIEEPPPKWSSWKLVGAPPEAEKAGCYAIYSGTTLLYIGMAVTEGKHAGTTGKKYGLLHRLKRHVVHSKSRGSDEYVPYEHKAQWKGITCIRLIGFPDAHRHLAAALEQYLITQLKSVVNAQSRWREA